MATYKVKNVPGFEHLLAVGNEWQLDDGHGTFEVVEVKTLINTSVVIGDRELKINLPDQAMFINIHNLELVPETEAQHEFTSDNPFGEFKYDGRFQRGDLIVTHAVYERAITITIVEKTREYTHTVYSDNFFSERAIALNCVERMLHGQLDPDDLIFELKDIKGRDTNG